MHARWKVQVEGAADVGASTAAWRHRHRRRHGRQLDGRRWRCGRKRHQHYLCREPRHVVVHRYSIINLKFICQSPPRWNFDRDRFCLQEDKAPGANSSPCPTSWRISMPMWRGTQWATATRRAAALGSTSPWTGQWTRTWNSRQPPWCVACKPITPLTSKTTGRWATGIYLLSGDVGWLTFASCVTLWYVSRFWRLPIKTNRLLSAISQSNICSCKGSSKSSLRPLGRIQSAEESWNMNINLSHLLIVNQKLKIANYFQRDDHMLNTEISIVSCF